MNKEYTVEKGKVISKHGVPLLPRWFCDDLVAVQAAEYGVSEIQYFNRTTRGSEKVFVADMWDGLKLYIDDCGMKNELNLSDTTVMPYGYNSVWEHEGNSFRFEMRIINNSVYFSVEPLSCKKKDLKLSLELYDAFCIIPRHDGDFRFVSRQEREWHGWEFENNVFFNSFSEEYGETHIAITANKCIEYIKRAKGYVKHIINVEDICSQKVIAVIAFDVNRNDCEKRAKETIENSAKYILAQNARYERVIKRAPVLKSPYASLNNFVSLAPLYHESCKVLSVPGAIRAKNEKYWVWGWDGMSSCYSYAYWGDIEFVGKLLKMYMDTADNENGIGHCFARDMRHIETSLISAQGFYINLLYQYYINGGDIKPFYEFAKKIFYFIKSLEVKQLGLSRGNSLVPDFREVILENGNDISCFNNTSAYCAVCAMAEMAEAMGDDKTFTDASEYAKRTRDNFKGVLYDEEKGYVVSSADVTTLEKRKVYNAMAVKWDNKYCNDLICTFSDRALNFFEKNFVCKSGLRPFPIWGIGYDEDANQARCYWPAHSEFFTRLANYENRRDLIDKFIGWISSWTDLLTCPEGISCYRNSEKPFIDKWNANNGTWQAYSMRAWYEAMVHSIVGVDIDKEGLTFYPYDGEELSLEGLHYGAKTIDIHMRGKGAGIKSIVLNNQEILSTNKLKSEQLDSHNIIIVNRY